MNNNCECYGKGYEKKKYQNLFFISHCSDCGLFDNDQEAYEEAMRS